MPAFVKVVPVKPVLEVQVTDHPLVLGIELLRLLELVDVVLAACLQLIALAFNTDPATSPGERDLFFGLLQLLFVALDLALEFVD